MRPDIPIYLPTTPRSHQGAAQPSPVPGERWQPWWAAESAHSPLPAGATMSTRVHSTPHQSRPPLPDLPPVDLTVTPAHLDFGLLSQTRVPSCLLPREFGSGDGEEPPLCCLCQTLGPTAVSYQGPSALPCSTSLHPTSHHPAPATQLDSSPAPSWPPGSSHVPFNPFFTSKCKLGHSKHPSFEFWFSLSPAMWPSASYSTSLRIWPLTYQEGMTIPPTPPRTVLRLTWKTGKALRTRPASPSVLTTSSSASNVQSFQLSLG